MRLSRQNLIIASAGVLLAVLGCALLVHQKLADVRSAFEADIRIAHRLLSQRAAQHDAVMAMLALMQSERAREPAEERLPSVYPQVLRTLRRDEGAAWEDSVLEAAEAASLRHRRPVLARAAFDRNRFQLVQYANPASFAVEFDLLAMVPWDEWPMARDRSPVQLALEHEGQRLVLQRGESSQPFGAFTLRKRLAAASQPFDVVGVRAVQWRDLPWLPMFGWIVCIALALTTVLVLEHQRSQRRRAEALLRLDQTTRLNTLGELTAGMAHELNQPLTAVLANTQAAQRWLDDEPPGIVSAQEALVRATDQAKRAADVVNRLRQVVAKRLDESSRQTIPVDRVVRKTLYLLEPELQRMQVQLRVAESSLSVVAEPVALEQIIHNLLTNALQALAQVPATERTLDIEVGALRNGVVITVKDSGPGIAADALPHLFEPFFTTRKEGLGLGLSLCETLAGSMHGNLHAENVRPRGAAFSLFLPSSATP